MSKRKVLIIVSIIIIFSCGTFLFLEKIQSSQYSTFVPVLMYHNVIKDDDMKYFKNSKYPDIFISTKKFERQMNLLKQNGYKTLTLKEFDDFVNGKTQLPKKCVLITFDDGRKNVYINAYPILKKNNFNAVIFLITSKNKNDNDKFNSEKLQYMSFSDIEKSKDIFEYGSHTNDMHKRTKEDNNPFLIVKSNKEIKSDIKQSFEIVKNPYLAYPYGSYNKNVKNILQELNVKMAFSTHKGKTYVGSSLYDIKRNGVSEFTTDNEFIKILGLKDLKY